jgi:hypothetical protein
VTSTEQLLTMASRVAELKGVEENAYAFVYSP